MTFNSIEQAKEMVKAFFMNNCDDDARFDAICYLQLHWGYKETCRFEDRLCAKYC